MNLTSKRMLQFITVCAGISALTASADPTQFVADNFENPPGTNGMPILYYKATLNEYQIPSVTNWFAAEGDASKLVEVDNSAAAVGDKGRPFATGDKSLVLNLETEGQTLARTVGSPLTFGETTPVYVDTLIKFTPSEDNPVIVDESVKAAVFVDVNSNLCIFHGVDSSGSAAAVATPTTIQINPELWYRLTIKLSNMPDAPLDKVFQVYLNGEVIVDDDGMDETYEPSTGSFFYTASNESTLSTIAFQGTGMVDELVVADMPSGFVPTTGILLTLSFNDTMVSVTTNGVAAANFAQVPSDTAVVITALPWYQITNPGGLFIGGETTNTFGSMITSISGTVSSGIADTNTIVAAAFNTTAGLPTGFGGLEINDVAGWAQDNSLTPAEMTEAMLDDYLFNVEPGTDAKPVIHSIVVNEDTGKATITVKATSALVDFTTIHGTIVVSTTESLATPFAEQAVSEFDITDVVTQTVTIDVDIPVGQYFIKAVVK